ncbi:MAG: hypothetical protein AW07_02822 [Candidatus Accumulibacter sp. SK-11]|nr:MAG: hypothetical protein AW07_02822 [Candidatus Accumulibacter sp. SK-11]
MNAPSPIVSAALGRSSIASARAACCSSSDAARCRASSLRLRSLMSVRMQCVRSSPSGPRCTRPLIRTVIVRPSWCRSSQQRSLIRPSATNAGKTSASRAFDSSVRKSATGRPTTSLLR